MTFSDLKLIQPLLSMLDKIGHSAPTPIQKQSIPNILEGKDIFGCAQTGTGKTAAFTLPLLQLLQADKNNASEKIRALILAPTRELVMQIGDNFKTYGENLSVTHTVVLGGVSQNLQISTLKKSVDVLIATPGRLLDLMNQGYICLDQVEYFVLDEADRMLDMGFIKDIQRIISKLPSKRQTLFFSATASPEIMKLAKTLLMNPVNVSVNLVSSTASLVEQSIYYVSKENKKSLLKYVLKNGKIDHALVFTRTKRGADKVARELNNNGIKAESIHGNKSQNARERALKEFKNRTIRILVATDIASRGIDVDKLTHVINYELPEQAETYVHRIGRTGRAGSSGTALSFCAQDELPYLNDIHKLIKRKIGTARVNPYA